MPDKPMWYGQLTAAIQELEGLPWPWIDRQTVERLLKVRPRRAQQILQPCVSRLIGNSGVADREEFIAHLKRLASGDHAHYERRRRERLAHILEALQQDEVKQPRLLVQAPTAVMDQQLSNLPEGVAIGSGMITVQFASPTEALEKLLALAMAIGNDFERFERQVSQSS
jgi:hypothetical protein